MSKEKFTIACERFITKARQDEVVTVIVRTKQAPVAEQEARQAFDMLQGEQMATRRAQLLARIQERYGRGAAFQKSMRESRLSQQAKVVKAAPRAANLWLADAVAVSGTRAEIEDLAGHEDIERVDVNPTYRVPEVLRTPLEDSLQAVDGSAWGLAKIQAPEVMGGVRPRGRHPGWSPGHRSGPHASGLGGQDRGLRGVRRHRESHGHPGP